MHSLCTRSRIRQPVSWSFRRTSLSSLVFDAALEPDTTKSEELARLTERHFLSHTPETAKGPRKNFLTRRCRVCHKNGLHKEVTHVSEQCASHPALCPVPCFKPYHRKRHTGSSRPNFVDLVDFIWQSSHFCSFALHYCSHSHCLIVMPKPVVPVRIVRQLTVSVFGITYGR